MKSSAPISSRVGIVLTFLFFVLTGSTKFVWAVEPPKNNSCVACHMDIWEETKNSIHSREGITCNNCHGGDPTQKEKELAKAPSTGYIGIPEKKQIATMCGTCHANVEVMNFYGIRTDQLVRYKTSMHGKRLFNDGDTHVAVCTDCHGYHNILDIGDPQSSVYPTNVPKTCNKCHGNERLMAPYHLPTDIFTQYESSVHGLALLKKNDLSAANCVSCHGGHGALPPGVKEVSDTCGKCHINEKKFFLMSDHAKLTDSKKFSECISCHGFHSIQHPTIQLLDTACIKCHDAKSPAVRRAVSMKELLVKSQVEVGQAKSLVKEAANQGLFVDEEKASFDEANTKMIEMGVAQHTLSIDELSKLSSKVAASTEEVRKGVNQKRQSLKWRKIALIFVWIFVLLMVVALWNKYKRLKFFWGERKKKQDNE